MQPSVTEADMVHTSTTPEDPWVAAAQAMGSMPWNPTKQALLVRVFMEFFNEVLRDYQLFLCASGQELSERAALSRRDSRLTSGGGSSSGSSSSGGAAPGSRVLCSSLSGMAAIGGALVAVRSNSMAVGAGALLQAQSIIGLQALCDHHYNICRQVNQSRVCCGPVTKVDLQPPLPVACAELLPLYSAQPVVNNYTTSR